MPSVSFDIWKPVSDFFRKSPSLLKRSSPTRTCFCSLLDVHPIYEFIPIYETQIKQKKMSSNYEVRERRRLLSNLVSHHEALPRDETISPQDFLREVRRTVISFIRGRPQNKVHLVLVCEMVRADPVTGRVVTAERSAFRSLQEPVYDSTDLEAMYERVVAKILESFSAFLRNGSGWMFKRIIKLEITFSRNRPV